MQIKISVLQLATYAVIISVKAKYGNKNKIRLQIIPSVCLSGKYRVETSSSTNYEHTNSTYILNNKNFKIESDEEAKIEI